MPNRKLSKNACLEMICLVVLQAMMLQENLVVLPVDVHFAVGLCVCVCFPVIKTQDSCILSLQDGVGSQEQQQPQ